MLFKSNARKKWSTNSTNRSRRVRHEYQQLERRNLLTGISLVSVSSDEVVGNDTVDFHSLDISTDGRFVAFSSAASNLVDGIDNNGNYDVFVRDNSLGTTTLVSTTPDGESSNFESWSPSISDDGRFVAFVSTSTDLVADGTIQIDVYLKDMLLDTVTLISKGIDGPPNGSSLYPAISSDGTKLTFDSDASNLVPNDTNGFEDVFLTDVAAGVTSIISRSSEGELGNSASQLSSISADGKFVAFMSSARNFAPDTNGRNVYLKNTQSGHIELVSR